jgi:hypothetical protein
MGVGVAKATDEKTSKITKNMMNLLIFTPSRVKNRI